MYSDKVKQIVKKWQRFACTGGYSDVKAVTGRMQDWGRKSEGNSVESEQAADGPVPEGSLAVYVGRERRRYILREEHVNHPLLKSLLARSSQGSNAALLDHHHHHSPGMEDGISIPCCEIVLFEHLLWLLRNSDSTAIQDSEELAEFYACS